MRSARTGTFTKFIRIGTETFASTKRESSGAAFQSFYHNDHLAGVNVITERDGNRVQLNEYDPWGALSRSEGTIDPTHRFTGQELDPETGFYYYGGRYFDQETGRFVSPDPFVQSPEEPQSLNRYTYVTNNPQTYNDPTGFEGEGGGGGGGGGWCLLCWLWEGGDDKKKWRPTPPGKSPFTVNRPQVANSGTQLSDNVSRYVDEGEDEPTWDPSGFAVYERWWEKVQSNKPPRRVPANNEKQDSNSIDWSKIASCTLSSTADQYGLTAAAGVSGLLSVPLPKWLVPPYRQIGSDTTNLLSVLGHYVEVNVPRITIGGRASTNLFRILGRVNPYVAAGLAAGDAIAIGYGTYHCYQGK